MYISNRLRRAAIMAFLIFFAAAPAVHSALPVFKAKARKHAPPAASTGRAFYISPAGSDDNSGSINSPWKTINHASTKLLPGDTLYARGGIYTEQGGYIWNSVSGTPAAPIAFKAYPGETPVFDGERTLGEWLVFGDGAGWITVDGFTVRRFDNSSGNGAISLDGANNITIQNCRLMDNGTSPDDHHIYIGANTSNIVIRSNELVRAAGAGIQFWHGPGCNGSLIYNNVFIGGRWGIVAGDGANRLQIYNNTFDGCQTALDFSYDGQETASGVEAVTMKNNIIANCSQYGLKVGPFNVNDISGDYNLWDGNANDVYWDGTDVTLDAYRSRKNERHSVSADPSFVGPSTGNYRLNPGSPAIDKGSALGKVTHDKDNAARPQGAGYDIGAYEYR